MFRSSLVNTNKIIPNSFPSQPSEVTTSPIITCDFDTYESTGCEDEEGSYCDSETQRCLCKEGYPIRLLSYCLPRKSIDEDCYTSSQCNQVKNAACFIFGKEYDNERISGGHNVGRQLSNWPTGTCRCNIGYQILPEILPNTANSTGRSYEESVTLECTKKTVGSWCTDDWDCIKETFNTQCARPQNICECSWGFYYDDTTDSCQIPKLYESKCTSDSDCSPEKLICSPRGRCVCPKGFHFDVIHPGCKPNDDSSCDFGYKWDEEWGRCIPARSAAAAFPFNQINSRNKNPSDKNSNGITESSTITTTSVFKDSSSESDSSTFSTILFIIVPNIILFALLGHYCYLRKREDEDEDADTSDLERGQLRSIRPTHNLFCSYPYRNGHPTAIRNDSIGTCCVGDKLLANLVTGHHLHHHHHHLPPSTLVTHDNSELVNGQPIGDESNGEVKSAAATGNSSGTSCAVIESRLENDDLPLPASIGGSSHEISVLAEETGNDTTVEKQNDDGSSQYEKTKVPESSSRATNGSSSSPTLSSRNHEKQEEGEIEKEQEEVMSLRLSNGGDHHSGNRENDSLKEGKEKEEPAAGQHSETVQGTNSVGNEIKASQVIIDVRKKMIDTANCDVHLHENLVPSEDTSLPCKKELGLEGGENEQEEEENRE